MRARITEPQTEITARQPAQENQEDQEDQEDPKTKKSRKTKIKPTMHRNLHEANRCLAQAGVRRAIGSTMWVIAAKLLSA